MRFTTHGDTLYAIALAWPEDGRVTIKSLASDIPLFPQTVARVELLGVGEPLQWSRDTNGLTITLPSSKPGEHAFAFRITPEKEA
ncbi:alpha-L-fucosidase C-terminal domain-containing protein [Dictyobacter kobayashii]|uniref:alpha-L-fucosidase C-terminal domain-containing protein n=1 Tax=Dictyobacter kobayashii TaxID=2014872 RepID=UPI0035305AB3